MLSESKINEFIEKCRLGKHNDVSVALNNAGDRDKKILADKGLKAGLESGNESVVIRVASEASQESLMSAWLVTDEIHRTILGQELMAYRDEMPYYRPMTLATLEAHDDFDALCHGDAWTAAPLISAVLTTKAEDQVALQNSLDKLYQSIIVPYYQNATKSKAEPWTLLQWAAAARQNILVMNELRDAETRERYGSNIVDIACLTGNLALIESCMAQGMKPSRLGFSLAILSRSQETIDYFMNQPDHIQGTDFALYQAINSRREDLAVRLLEKFKFEYEVNEKTLYKKFSPILLAAHLQFSALLKMLVERKANLTTVTKIEEVNALHIVVDNQDLESCRVLLEAESSLAEEKRLSVSINKNKVTPLMLACQAGQTEIAELFLQHLAQHFSDGKLKQDALIAAFKLSKNPEVIKRILELFKFTESEIDNILYDACLELNRAQVDLILASTHKPSPDRLTNLVYRLLKNYHTDEKYAQLVSECLLPQGAFSGRQRERLIIRSESTQSPLVQCLTEHLRTIIRQEFKPLTEPSTVLDPHALKKHKAKTLEELKSDFAKAWKENDMLDVIHEICLMIQYGMQQGQEETIGEFQALLMDVYREATTLSPAPMVLAAACGLADEVKREFREDLNQRTLHEILITAAINGHRNIVESFLDPKYIPKTFVWTLIQYGRHDFYELLKERCPDFASQYCAGALQAAIRADDYELFCDLINHKVNLDDVLQSNITPLLYAAQVPGKTRFAIKMIEAGAFINAREEGNHRTAIEYACDHGDLALVKALLATKQAYLEAGQFRGLHLAAEHGHDEIVEALLEAAPMLATALNSNHETPLSLAILHKRSDALIQSLFELDPDTTEIAFIQACFVGNIQLVEQFIKRKMPSLRAWELGLQAACHYGEDKHPNVIRRLLQLEHKLTDELADEIKRNCQRACPEINVDIDAKLQSQQPVVVIPAAPVDPPELPKAPEAPITTATVENPVSAPEEFEAIAIETLGQIDTNRPRTKLLAIDFDKTWSHVEHPEGTNPDLKALVKMAKAAGWEVVFVTHRTHEESLRNISDAADALQMKYGSGLSSNWKAHLNHSLLLSTDEITPHLSIGYPDQTNNQYNTIQSLMNYEDQLIQLITMQQDYKALILKARKWFKDQFGESSELKISPANMNYLDFDKAISEGERTARELIYRAEYYKRDKRPGNECKLHQLSELRDRFNAEVILMIDDSSKITTGINQVSGVWQSAKDCSLRAITYPSASIARIANKQADQADYDASKQFDAEMKEAGFDLESDRAARQLAIKELTAYQHRRFLGVFRLAGHKARAEAMIHHIRDPNNHLWRQVIDNQLSKFTQNTTSEDFTYGKSSLEKAFKWKTKAWFWDTLQKIKRTTAEPEDRSNELRLD